MQDFVLKSARNLTWHIFDAFVRKILRENLTKSSKIKFIDFGVKSLRFYSIILPLTRYFDRHCNAFFFFLYAKSVFFEYFPL